MYNKYTRTYFMNPQDLLHVGKPYWQRKERFSSHHITKIIADWSKHPYEFTSPLIIELGFPEKGKNFPNEDEKARENFRLDSPENVRDYIHEGYGYIIDGQQRLSAICTYWTAERKKLLRDSTEKEYFREINNILKKYNNPKLTKNNELNFLDNLYKCTTWISSRRLSNNTHKNMQNSNQIQRIIKKIRKYENHYNFKYKGKYHLNLPVPVAICKHPESSWERMYRNINYNNVDLNTRELIDGAWGEVTIKLPHNAVGTELQNLKLKYFQDKKENSIIRVNTRGFLSINDYIISISSLAHVIGMLMHKYLPTLVPDTVSQKDYIGFGLLCILIRQSPSKLGKMNEKNAVYIKNHLLNSTGILNTNIIARWISLAEALNWTFDSITHIKSFKNNFYIYLASKMDTLSYFASLMNVSRKEMKHQLKNIRISFLESALLGSRMKSNSLEKFISGNLTYHDIPISKEDFTTLISRKIDAYNPENVRILGRDKKTVIRQLRKITKKNKNILLMHANIFYFKKHGFNLDKFQFDHGIMPIGLAYNNEIHQRTNKFKLGEIGNLFYIPSNINISKNTQTLYSWCVDNHQLNQMKQYFKDSHYIIGMYKKSLNGLQKQHYNWIHHLKKHQYTMINHLIATRSKELVADLINYFYKDI